MTVINLLNFEGLPAGTLTAAQIASNSGNWFTGITQIAAGRVTAGTPAAVGTVAGGFNVASGDNPARTEVCCGAIDTTSERWFQFYVRFPSGSFTPNPGSSFNLFWYAPSTNGNFQANLQVKIDTTASQSRFLLVTAGGATDNANQRLFYLQPSWSFDTWYRFSIGCLFRTDSTGWIQAFIDGEERLAKTFTPTLYVGYGVYVRTGFWRSTGAFQSLVLLDSISQATSPDDYGLTTTVPAPLTVSQSISNGSTLSGPVTWTGTVTGGAVNRVEFSVDGALHTTDTTSPYSAALDTTLLANGQHTFAVTAYNSADSAFTSSVTATVSNQAQPPSILTQTLPNGNSGQAYSQALQATGGVTPYTWSLDSGSLPPGITLSASGTISGTPTQGGDFPLVVRVTGGNGSFDTQQIDLAIQPVLATGNFGRDTVSGSTTFSAATLVGRVFATRYTLGVRQAVSALDTYVRGNGATNPVLDGLVTMGIWADLTPTNPGALIAQTEELTIRSNAPAGYYRAEFLSPPTLDPGNYWIGIAFGGAEALQYGREQIAGALDIANDPYDGTLPNPFP